MPIRPITFLLHPISLFALLSSLLAGCHATGSAAIKNEPAFSQLAGRWWISLRDLHESKRPGKADQNSEEPRFAKTDHLLAATIRSDGSFDWSRTFMGASKGIHDLRDVGDQCIAHASTRRMYEVVASKYTPTASQVEFCQVDLDTGAVRASKRYKIQLSLRNDGSVDYEDTGLAGVVTSGAYRSLTPRGHHSKSSVIKNASSIAGNWSAKGSDPKLVLIIRADGTFDWNGTGVGPLLPWYQLEQVGDRGCNLMNPDQTWKVTASSYTPTESELRFRVTQRLSNGETEEADTELVVRHIDDVSVRVSFKVNAGANGSINHAMTLYRNDDTELREGSVWAFLIGRTKAAGFR